MTKPVAISVLEYHVLLSMANGPRYGYSIRERVESESGGTLTPPAGSLYRVVARLMSRGWIEETDAPEAVAPHPGLARRYYGLTTDGRAALADEARRLREVSNLAARRLRSTEGRA
jgi:DNA-binding PadR family transcriptional regulator